MQINIQPIEKLSRSDGQTLDVHSIFHTIQGEGPFVGHPCIFVRLAGCNLQCPGCDTDYTLGRKMLDHNEIVDLIGHQLWLGDTTVTRVPLVVITGGEPFRQNIAPFCNALLSRGHTIQIETNGTMNPGPEFCALQKRCESHLFVVCSPKASRVNDSVLSVAGCFKYVMHHSSVDPKDGLSVLALENKALPRVARPKGYVPIYLQPMDTGNEADNKLSLDACIASCRKYGYILGIQTHKLIGLP